MSSKQHPTVIRSRHLLLNRNCMAMVLQRVKADAYTENGHALFTDFLQQNSVCFWNSCLLRSVASLEYRGYLVPTTLLVSGTNFALEVVRSAWARRVLRAPKGYTISKFGDVGPLEMLPVSQTQFAPLSEALCKVVADLNGEQVTATADSVQSSLEQNFPEMQVPSAEILHKTLGGLIRERKIYHTGNGYFVVNPDTYRQLSTSPLGERQMLMTNEEAIVRLHSRLIGDRCSSIAIQVDEADIAAAWRCSTSSFLHASNTSDQSVQVPSPPDLLETSHSLRMLRARKGHSPSVEEHGSLKQPKKTEHMASELDGDVNKSEKQSVLAKLLKRMQFLTDKSSKHIVFSAQFPPIEWLEIDKLCCHSVATQTQLLLQQKAEMALKRSEQSGLKIPWKDLQTNFNNRIFSYHLSPNATHRRLYHMESDERGLKRNITSIPVRINNTKYSPTHRYSHGTFTGGYAKRRYKHKRSSSESPKIYKSLINGSKSSKSTSSKSNSDEKVSRRSSSNGSVKEQKSVRKTHEAKSDQEKRTNSNCLSKIVSPYGCQPSVQLPMDSLGNISNISNHHAKFSVSKMGNTLCKSDEDEVDPKQSIDPPTSEQFRTTLKPTELHEFAAIGEKTRNKELETIIQPLLLKNIADIPKSAPRNKSPSKEIVIDNSVSVEVALEKNTSPKNETNNVSTTIVTEETTVTKRNRNSKVVTVTSITTSLSQGDVKDLEKQIQDKKFRDLDASTKKSKQSVNNLNIETEKSGEIIDCSSSCNIVTEVN